MERVRKLFARRELLRLGRAQRLRTNDAVDAGRNRKFRVQNARSVSTSDKNCARKTGHHRRIRLRFTQSQPNSAMMTGLPGAIFVRRGYASRILNSKLSVPSGVNGVVGP